MESNAGFYIGFGIALLILPLFGWKQRDEQLKERGRLQNAAMCFGKMYLTAFFSLTLVADTAMPLLGSPLDIAHYKLSVYWLSALPAVSAALLYLKKQNPGPDKNLA